MPEPRLHHRSIRERWVITGTLELETPAHFGNGDTDALTDMPLVLDEVSGKPLLAGTSIAGALRNSLRLSDIGYGKQERRNSPASHLFGGTRMDDEGAQSALIVFDALGEQSGIELRDGVAIDADTRTAADEKKFDIQLLAAGSTFNLRFELVINGKEDSQTLRNTLALALCALEAGEISLGARKMRGFGQCKAGNWQVWKFDLRDKDQFLAWLEFDREWTGKQTVVPRKDKPIHDLLDAKIQTETRLKRARLSATFAIDGSLMVRSGFGEADNGPDMVHLHSHRPGKNKRVPVISGTSWAGVLRHRARAIARTLSNNSQAYDAHGKPLFHRKDKTGIEKPILSAEVFVDSLFGPSEIRPDEKNTRASRVAIRETEIQDVESLVITRVKIDRFTGGALESHLFSEQPVVGKPQTGLQLEMTILEPSEAEIGLALLLLRDLWTGDLPVGGESGVGRGRLKGVSACLNTLEGEWKFAADGDHKISVEPGNQVVRLEEYVTAFNQAMKSGGGR